MESDQVYFLKRAAEERAAAETASHPRARDAHLEMAAGYDRRIEQMGAQDLRGEIHLVGTA